MVQQAAHALTIISAQVRACLLSSFICYVGFVMVHVTRIVPIDCGNVFRSTCTIHTHIYHVSISYDYPLSEPASSVLFLCPSWLLVWLVVRLFFSGSTVVLSSMASPARPPLTLSVTVAFNHNDAHTYEVPLYITVHEVCTHVSSINTRSAYRRHTYAWNSCVCMLLPSVDVCQAI